MSSITTSYHANVAGTANRAAGNPAGNIPYSQSLPSSLNRAHLFIQNKGGSDIQLSLSATGATISLYGGSSISIDNYAGGFTLSSYSDVSIQEAFTQ